MTDAEMMQALLDGKTAEHPNKTICFLEDGKIVFQGPFAIDRVFPNPEYGWKIKKRTVYVNFYACNSAQHFDTEEEARGQVSEFANALGVAVPVEI